MWQLKWGSECEDENEAQRMECNTHEYLLHVIYTNPTKYVIGLKHGEENLAHKVISLIQTCNDIDTLKSKISLLISSFSSPSQIETFRLTITWTPNSSHVKQPRFWLGALTTSEMPIHNITGELSHSISYMKIKHKTAVHSVAEVLAMADRVVQTNNTFSWTFWWNFFTFISDNYLKQRPEGESCKET